VNVIRVDVGDDEEVDDGFGIVLLQARETGEQSLLVARCRPAINDDATGLGGIAVLDPDRINDSGRQQLDAEHGALASLLDESLAEAIIWRSGGQSSARPGYASCAMGSLDSRRNQRERLVVISGLSAFHLRSILHPSLQR